MHLKSEIKENDFLVEQRLAHYSVGEGLSVYNLKAIASKQGYDKMEVVKNAYGICFEDELQHIYWFSDFESRAKHIHAVKRGFQKAYAKSNCSFENFPAMFEKYRMSPEDIFKTLVANDGDMEEYILVEYDEYEQRCRFYKEHSDYAQKWMPHLEPFNHKKWMTTDEKYDIDALYAYLLKKRNVFIVGGIEEIHDVFTDDITRIINFYVRIEEAKDAKRDLYEDLPKTAIDISRFELSK